MLFYTQRLTDALNERFDDIDEVYDVANYGCSMGVSDFVYYHETTKFFHEFEDDIEDVCHDTLGEDFMEQLHVVQQQSEPYSGDGLAHYRDVLSASYE
jgi:hypothetical protein